MKTECLLSSCHKYNYSGEDEGTKLKTVHFQGENCTTRKCGKKINWYEITIIILNEKIV